MNRHMITTGMCACFTLIGCAEPRDPQLDDPLSATRRVISETSGYFPKPGFPGHRPAPELLLKLSAASTQPRDHIVVTVTVTNHSKRSLAWDREFSVHLDWVIRACGSEDVRPERSQRLAPPDVSEFAQRFMILDPGQSISHDTELSGVIRVSSEGHGTGPRSHGNSAPTLVHVGLFSEDLAQFPIPESCDRVDVRLSYGDDPMARAAFASWFGQKLADLPEFADGNIQSNGITVQLK